MEKARYGSIHGDLVDVEEFLRRASPEYKKKGILPYCDACHEPVDVYGAHTSNPETVRRFDHRNLSPDTDPLDDCILANRNQRFRGLSPDGFDDIRGQRIRAQFLEPNFLARCYAFCLSLCRKGNLPTEKFRSMLLRAERKRIWAYAGIHLWAIPYILLTLENFYVKNDKNCGCGFHFVFQKPNRTTVSALWTRHNECRLLKVFSDTGRAMQSTDNPFSVSEDDFLTNASNTDWIRPNTILSLLPYKWSQDRKHLDHLVRANQT